MTPSNWWGLPFLLSSFSLCSPTHAYTYAANTCPYLFTCLYAVSHKWYCCLQLSPSPASVIWWVLLIPLPKCHLIHSYNLIALATTLVQTLVMSPLSCYTVLLTSIQPLAPNVPSLPLTIHSRNIDILGVVQILTALWWLCIFVSLLRVCPPPACLCSFRLSSSNFPDFPKP